MQYLQYVAYNTDAPHVSSEPYTIEIDDFWCDELRRSEEDLKLFVRVVLPRQPKVYDLDSVSGFSEAEYVLRLHVEVEDILFVDKFHPFAYLSHEHGAWPFRQDEIVVDHSFE